MVKLLSPQIQCGLAMRPSDSFYFHTDVTVQTFVRTVILGMSRSAPLQIDAQSYPPGL